MSSRSTRSNTKKRQIEEGIVDPPKQKRITLGQHLADLREEESEMLLKNDDISKYEPFQIYNKVCSFYSNIYS